MERQSAMQVDSQLQGQIRCLTELYNSLQSLRQIPSLVVRPHVSSASTSLGRQEFKELKNFGEKLCSDAMQDALCAARESEMEDNRDIIANGRRENRKRRRPPSPESPKPYVSPDRKSTSLFPIEDGGSLKVDDLPDYIREFNRSNRSKLHVWSGTRLGELTNPTILRFTIQNVLTSFITLGHGDDDLPLVIETVAALGPREKKSPHSQSDYTTYQVLSQQIAKMVQSQPRVSLQALMSLLCSYEGIFIDRCTSCQRVLSSEGHVPPVARVSEKGQWQPRHDSCLRGL